jgi:hypothetical protein
MTELAHHESDKIFDTYYMNPYQFWLPEFSRRVARFAAGELVHCYCENDHHADHGTHS